MDYSMVKVARAQPRVIIHGGAGNISKDNLPPEAHQQYKDALLDIVLKAHIMLATPWVSALDVATYAVSLLEENPLFNAGHGAVFNRDGRHELEASIMTSKGYRKRGVGVMKVTKAKSPIKLAREMLVRGEMDDGGGALSHCQLEGDTIDRLAQEWGLDLVSPSYFWTRKRWDEHRKGLGLSHSDEEYQKAKLEADGDKAENCRSDNGYGKEAFSINDSTWDGREYLPQGTVGAVALDSDGMVCVATSTGGLTNKLPGRIGDTPTIGAGFFAEEWVTSILPHRMLSHSSPASQLASMLGDCLPMFSEQVAPADLYGNAERDTRDPTVRAVAMSGTGNGDSFLRLSAVRTAAAMARFSGTAQDQFSTRRFTSLQETVTAVAGPNGMLQQSAGDRWGKTGEGEGGIIGIDFANGHGRIVADFNCGGMFHAWIDDHGESRFAVFQEDDGPRS